MKEKLYFFTLKIPDLLFTVVEILLVSRFVAKILEVSDTPGFTHWLYQTTTILTFPIGIALQHFFVESSMIYETFLVGSCVIYLLMYLVILDFLKRVFNEKDDE